MSIVPLLDARSPAFLIHLSVENAPIVFADVQNDGDEARLLNWIESQPPLLDLFSRAVDLQGEARAA
jgi:hypothetical protein